MVRSLAVHAYEGGGKVTVGDDGFSIEAPGWRLDAGIPGLLLADDAGTRTPVVPAAAPVRSAASRDGFAGAATEYSFGWTGPEGLETVWRVTVFRHSPVVMLGATVRNTSARPVRLAEIGLLSQASAHLSCEGDSLDWVLSSLGCGSRNGSVGEKLPSSNEQTIALWKGFNQPVPFKLGKLPFDTDGDWRCFRDWMTLYKDSGETGLTAAAVGEPRAWAAFRCHAGKCGDMAFEVASEMSDAVLAPGQSRDAQEIALFLLPYRDALPLAMRWQAATHGVRIHRKTAVGWCSWYSMGPNVTADIAIRVANTFEAERRRIQPEFIQVDDGFEKTVGDWDCNEKFPDGLDPVVSAFRKAGAIPGIWLSPLLVHEKTAIFRDHPDWFQRRADGTLTGQAGNWGPTAYYLDPTHPGAAAFLGEVLIEFKRQGFRYFKIDFNGIADDARFHDSAATGLEAYRRLYRIYREAVGEESFLLACSGFTRGVFGYADAVRTGPDSCSNWKAPHDCCVSRCLESVANSAWANRVLFTCDPDVTYLGPAGSLTEEEWKTWHSHVGTLGGLTAISDRIDQPERRNRLRMLEILNPPAPETGLPLGGGCDIFLRWLGYLSRRPWGEAAVATGYNPAGAAATLTVNPASTGLRAAEKYLVWSFWEETARFAGPGPVTFEKVPSHGCVMVRITPVPEDPDEPFLAGSTLHISCGGAEIADFRFTAESIDLELTDAGARDGALFLCCRDGLALECAAGLTADTPRRVSEHLFRIEVRDRKAGERQSLTLRRTR